MVSSNRTNLTKQSSPLPTNPLAGAFGFGLFVLTLLLLIVTLGRPLAANASEVTASTSSELAKVPSTAGMFHVKRPRTLDPSRINYSSPWVGNSVANIPPFDRYEASSGSTFTGHLETLDALSKSEAFSSLLSPKQDAQRERDLDDSYYAPASGWGHVVPQIMPFRQKLARKGITFSVGYKGELLGNFHGGLRGGEDYISRMDYGLNFDLGKMFGFRNWSVHAVMMDKTGRQTSHDKVGEYIIPLQQSMGITGNKAFRLADLYAEKNFFSNHLDIAFGRMTLTHIFATSPLLCTFMTTCSAPAAIKADPGMSRYPKGSWGSRAIFRPTRDTRFIIGAFQVYANAQDPDGWAWGSEKTTGLSLPIEFAWTPFIGPQKLAGSYKFGFMHDTSNYDDMLRNDFGSLAKAWHAAHRQGQPPHSHGGGNREDTNVFWFEMEQMVYRTDGRNKMAGGYVMSGFIHNTPHVSIIDNQAYGGISLNGIFKERPQDRIGILYSWYHISDRRRADEIALINNGNSDDLATAMVLGSAYGTYGSLGPKVKGPQSSTQIIEAYYSVNAAPGLTVQPEFLYQIKPGETHHIPDSAMLGMKVTANL